MIELRKVRHRWRDAGRDVVAIDALDIATGESVFVYGPSGSGKSTLLGLVAGVLLPHEGSVALLGTKWSTLSGSQRDRFRADHVGYIFQQFNLLPYLSVLDNVLLPCRFSRRRFERAGGSGAAVRDAAQGLLREVGLYETLWTRSAVQLSVGQQQRVAAARALIGRPELVIADEPTSSLDAPLRDAFMDLLLGECRTTGSTLVFVSHDERLASRFDRRLALADINRAPVDDAPRLAA